MVVLGAEGVASVLITADTTRDLHVAGQWPLLFGTGAAGARGLLTAGGRSMITVAGPGGMDEETTAEPDSKSEPEQGAEEQPEAAFKEES